MTPPSHTTTNVKKTTAYPPPSDPFARFSLVTPPAQNAPLPELMDVPYVKPIEAPAIPAPQYLPAHPTQDSSTVSSANSQMPRARALLVHVTTTVRPALPAPPMDYTTVTSVTNPNTSSTPSPANPCSVKPSQGTMTRTPKENPVTGPVKSAWDPTLISVPNVSTTPPSTNKSQIVTSHYNPPVTLTRATSTRPQTNVRPEWARFAPSRMKDQDLMMNKKNRTSHVTVSM